MSFPTFFIHPPKCGGSTVISCFDLNKGNDQFISFVWDQDGWGHCRAKLLETQVGGGHLPYGIHRIIKHPVNYCTILRDPLSRQISHYLYAANGKNGQITRGVSVSTPEAMALQVPKGKAHISEATRQRFIDDNSLDYELFRDANRMIESYAKETGDVFSNALELVRVIQSEIDQLENPHVYSATVFGIDGSFLARVQEVIRRFDLAPINTYLEFAQSRQRPRADVAGAGYPSLQSGFSISLPDGIPDGFRATAANSTESLHNAGTWRQGWHCE
ncbi:hypothetical protein [Paraburkholderia sp. HP33-1]|uniref:hypothetical protein n=1 Tax=Paraburkholderia sp. HP33-1 TaxID=2883243 RepID=UPI001F2B80CB|nr:hypothetical protein [Paraburkholderia sp. HP33-1]